MRRRDLLAGAGAAAGVAAGFPRPALAQGLRELKMVTDWPEGLPGLQASAVRLAETIGVASGGRIRIEVFPAGTFVKAFETFEAVGAGVAEMFHSAPAYFDKKRPGRTSSQTVPFGFTADELFAWMNFGGGQELWDELYGRYEVKPLLALSTGAQMGGWFNKEITSPESSRASDTGCRALAARCCGGSGPRLCSFRGARSCRRSSRGRSTPASGPDRGST